MYLKAEKPTMWDAFSLILTNCLYSTEQLYGRIYSRITKTESCSGEMESCMEKLACMGRKWSRATDRSCVLVENIEIRGITLLDGGSWHSVFRLHVKIFLIEDVNVLGK